MKIKFYIVTYKRYLDLHRTLLSLFNTDIDEFDVEVFVVNNHSDFKMGAFESKNGDARKITVLHNTFRPDFSCGHLARNYNEILIHGFKHLDDNVCDIVVHSHDDNGFDEKLFSKLVSYHEKYDIVTSSQGCGLVSYVPNGVKRVGMWDERFCTIGYHEGDYFLRAIKYNSDRVSINDWQGARRRWNEIEPLAFKLEGTNLNESHLRSQHYYPVCRELWVKKWGTKIIDTTWSDEALNEVINDKKNEKYGPFIPQYMFYPYFEKSIDDVNDKYYYGVSDLTGPKFF